MAIDITAPFDNTTLSDSLKVELIEGEEKAALKNASDDFADSTRGWQWEDYLVGGTSSPVESGGVLTCDITSGSGSRNRGYKSPTDKVTGNFDIHVDFSNFTGGTIDRSAAVLHLSIDPDNYIIMRRDKNAFTDGFEAVINKAGVLTNIRTASTVTSGSLRIIRNGGIVALLIDKGSGWEIGSMEDGFSTDDGTIRIYSQAHDVDTVTVDLDNFLVEDGGWFSTSAPSIKTETIDLGSVQKILSSEILIPSNTIAADTDIQVALSLDGGAFSSYYDLDSAALDNLYPIKAGEIGGNAVTCKTIQMQIKLNSSGTVYQECGKTILADVETKSKRDFFGHYGHRRIG